MPPKQNKKQEEEALRLLQEEQKRKEEEEKQRQEMLKFQVVKLETGLELFLTEYFVAEVSKGKNSFQFTIDYLKQYLKMNQYQANFKPIDLQLLAETILYDFTFAQHKLLLQDLDLCIIINIFFNVYKYKNPKFISTPYTEIQVNDYEGRLNALKVPPPYTKVAKSTKNKEDDYKLFKELCRLHASDEIGCKKVLKGDQLAELVNFANEGYFGNWEVIDFVNWNTQREEDFKVQLVINEPELQNWKPLDIANFIDLNQLEKKDEPISEEKVEDHHEEEQEEELDPLIQKLIQEKLQLANQQIEKKLENRQRELEEKIQDMQNTKKGKK